MNDDQKYFRAGNQHIRMISEESHETEDWSIDIRHHIWQTRPFKQQTSDKISFAFSHLAEYIIKANYKYIIK